jgi:integrase
MVRQLGHYLPDRDVRRKTAARKNLAWQANGIDPQVVISNARELDERLGLMLALQHAFGLRMKEAIEMRPEFSRNENESMLEIYRGTKGGRLRGVPIDSDYKREVFEWALRIAASSKSGRVRRPDLTWAQARRRYYYLLAEKMGINKREKGVSSHGLRHEFSQSKYRDIAGMPTPIEGGDPAQVDPARHKAANIAVAKQLGHGRVQVTASYYGSHGHRLRRKS